MTAQTQDLYAPMLQQASDKKYDLIIVTGFTWSFDLDEVAKQYPTQKYMIVDVDWVPNPNVMQVTFAEHEGSFLVGVVAALKAKADGIAKPKFGFIGGIPGWVITKFEVGYVQGIKYVLPTAEVVDYYANDWGKPELAMAQAKNWFDSGIYAIFSVAGGTGNGTIVGLDRCRVGFGGGPALGGGHVSGGHADGQAQQGNRHEERNDTRRLVRRGRGRGGGEGGEGPRARRAGARTGQDRAGKAAGT